MKVYSLENGFCQRASLLYFAYMEERHAWHVLESADVIRLQQGAVLGLSDQEAVNRLRTSGRNILKISRPTSVVKIFWHQLQSPFTLLLAIAVIISLLLHEWWDAIATGCIVLLNAGLGFFQEYRADRALFALQHLISEKALVRRDGEVRSIEAADIVPGDIILLSAGAKIPADARLLSVHSFATYEAALTGESAEVEKSIEPVAASAAYAEHKNMIFAGTTVARGKAEAIVVATGIKTVFGSLAVLTATASEQATPLTKDLHHLSRQITLIALAIAAIIFLFGVLKEIHPSQMLSTSIALAVAAVPEGLLIGFTMTLAVGMRRMLGKQALVRRLLSAETLGSVTIMCIDKTGTLTTGNMTLQMLDTAQSTRSLTYLHALSRGAATHAQFASSLTEQAIAQYVALHAGFVEGEVFREIAFDSHKKYSGVILGRAQKKETVLMGAPEILFPALDVSDARLQELHDRHKDLTAKGFRVLLLIAKDGEVSEDALHDFSFIGFLGFIDPLRVDAKEMIANVRALGIRFMMLTGDHPDTAWRIAKDLGFSESGTALTGEMIRNMADRELTQALRYANIIARINPEDKMRIVQLLQQAGEVVAMTGDGVNDAPALKRADIGVSLGSATDVAKETADIVLLDNRLQTLVDAVGEGRLLFSNIRNMTAYLLTFSLSEILLITGALLTGLPLPLTALQILWLNVVCDGLPALGFAFERVTENTARSLPRSSHEHILQPSLRRFTIIACIFVSGIMLSLMYALSLRQLPLSMMQTILFFAIGLDALLLIFVFRRLDQGLGQMSQPYNKELWMFVMMSGVLLVGLLVWPAVASFFGFVWPTWSWIMVVGLLSVLKMVGLELARRFILAPHRLPERSLLS